jgi:hypothetical protein
MAGDMARTCVVALLGVLPLLLPGCGGSAPSPPGYVAAGDAICTVQLAQLNALPQPTTPEGAVSYLPRALAIIQRERRQLAALHPSAPTRAQFTAGLEGQGQLAALLSRVLHQLQTGLVEVGTFSRVETESDTLRADISAHLRQAGLARCAN